MKKLSKKLILTFICTLIFNFKLTNSHSSVKRLVCYLEKDFEIDSDIVSKSCTHLVYIHDELKTDDLINKDNELLLKTIQSSNDYKNMIRLKEGNKNIRILIGIKNSLSDSKELVHSMETKTIFANKIFNLIKKVEFDGLDLNLDYSDSNTVPNKDFISQLVTELSNSFKQFNLVLGVTLSANKDIAEKVYDIQLISKSVLFVNLVTYNMQGSDSLIEHHTSLFARTNKIDSNKPLTIDYMVDYFIDNGLDADKINLGLAFFGRTFQLVNATENVIGSSAKGLGSPGKLTKKDGILAYYEVCNRLKEGYTREWSDEQRVPYAYENEDWVGYDDVQSLFEKLNFAKSKDLGGVFIKSLDFDDRTGKFCSQGKYPLLNLVKSELGVETLCAEKKQTPDEKDDKESNVAPQQGRSKRMVCYYTNWSQYRPGDKKFFPENVDASLCTHVIYGFAKMTNYELAAFEWNDENTDWSKGMYERAWELKRKNPSLKLMLAVGGWNMGSTEFSAMVHDNNLRSKFVRTAVVFLKKNKFDGLDLDWEYPANREGSQPSDRELFTTLCSELKAAFRSDGLLLSAAVGAGKSTIDKAYEIAKIGQLLDFLNLMTYDLHGSWEKFTGHHSALYARNDETDEEQKTLNVDFALTYWINGGFPSEKINLGLALYGRTFTLVDASQNGLGAPAKGAGTAGTYTREPGFVSYYEICSKLQSGYTRSWNDEQKVPYAYSGTEWVGYEDVESLKIKVNYLNSKNVGGAMVWALDLDDFNGNGCNNGKYPLLSTIKSQLSAGFVPDVTTASIPTQPTTQVTAVTVAPTQVTNDYNNNVGSKRMVCYYTNWSQYRPGDKKFVPENVDPTLCTHMIYAFAKMTNYELAAFEWNDENMEWAKGMYERAYELKQKNPNMKLLIAVGGWNMGSTEFSAMVHDNNLRSKFVRTAVVFLKKNKFDGLDLDWEYPGNREGSQPSDRELFTTLCSELKEAFRPHGLLLSAAVGAGKETIDKAYEIPKIGKLLDFLNLMTYDLHGSWDSITGHHSGLYHRSAETDPVTSSFNVDFALNYWIDGGFPKEKINLGLALYGRTFKLTDPSQNGLGAPAKGAGTAGTYTREPGFLAYYEICKNLQQGWTRVWDDEQKVPFAYSNTDWVGYEDEESLKIKVSYLINKGIGGAMVWALDLDDFNGSGCNKGNYPLLSVIKSSLGGSPYVDVVTSASSTSSYATTTQYYKPVTTKTTRAYNEPTKSSNRAKCSSGDGYHPDVDSGCTKFYLCQFSGTPSESVISFTCPNSLLFDTKIKACNYMHLVSCPTRSALRNLFMIRKASLDNKCTSGNGKYADYESGCKNYYECQFYGTSWQNVNYSTCPPGTLFDMRIKNCMPENVVECKV